MQKFTLHFPIEHLKLCHISLYDVTLLVFQLRLLRVRLGGT